MVKSWKRIASVICAICMVFTLIPVTSVSATDYYSATDVANLKPTKLSNTSRANYVQKMIQYHILSETDNYRIARNLDDGKCIVFFFDGCSDNMDDPAYSDYTQYHLSAYCCVVKEVDGKLKIVYEDENSSTIPDNPRNVALNEDAPVPTVLDGVYNIMSWNHSDRYAALHITDNSSTSVPVIRCSESQSNIDSSKYINIHARSNFNNTPTNGISSTSFSSTGCFNVGLTNDTWKEYNSFIYAILGISNAIITNPYSAEKGGKWTKCTEGTDYGCVVVDRYNYQDQLKAIYGGDNSNTAEELVNTIVDYTKSLNPDSITSGSGSTPSLLDTAVITSPNSGSSVMYDQDVTFKWASVDGATEYHIGVNDLTTGESLSAYTSATKVGNDYVVTGTSCTLDGAYVKSGHQLKFAVGAYSDEAEPEDWGTITVNVSSSNTTSADWQMEYNPNVNSKITPELIQNFLESYSSGGLSKTSTPNGQTVLSFGGKTYDLGFSNYYDYGHTNSIAKTNPLSEKSTAQTLTPAEIIYYACVENNMNVVWMLAKLQDEQSLIASTTAQDNYQTALNRAVGYMKIENGIRSHYVAGEKFCGFIGQVIGATWQYNDYIESGITDAEACYNRYTPPEEAGNTPYDEFISTFYQPYATWFDENMSGIGGGETTEFLDYPVITSPSENGNYSAGNAITFSWNAVSDATYYLIGVKNLTTDETLTGEILGVSSDEDNRTSKTSLVLNGSYVNEGDQLKFAVGAGNDGGLSSAGWSSVTITVAEGGSETGNLAYPNIISPIASNTYSAGTALTFEWNPVEGADYYKVGILDVDTNTTLTGAILGTGDNEQNTVTNCSVVVPAAYVTAGQTLKFAVGAESYTGLSSPGWSSVTITVDEGESTEPSDPGTDYGSVIDNGTCGDNLTWTLYDSGTLVIDGNGEMTAFNADAYPWYSYIDKVTKVVFNDGVTTIANNAFKNYDLIQYVVFPNTISKIGADAFYDCDAITNIQISDSVTSIGESAFRYCDALTSVYMGKNVTSVGAYVFQHCSALTTITIPDSLTSMGGRVFEYTTIRKVIVPESVISIHSDIRNYSTITSFEADNEDTVGYYTVDGVLYHYDEYTDITTLVRCPQAKTVRNFIISEEVDVIGANAFAYNDSLVTITFCENTVSIGADAFYDCDAITNIQIPDSVTSIGESAFRYCDALTSVSVGENVTSIGTRAFQNCPKLAAVYYYGAPPTSVGSYAFSDVSANIVMYYTEGSSGWTNPWNGFTTATFIPENSDVAVNGVTLNKSSATLEIGGTITLTATVSPSDATNKSVTWTSSNSSVAKVSGGTVTALSVGTATITVTTADGGYKAQCVVTVEAEEVEVPVDGAAITVGSASVTAGKTITIPVDIQKNPGIVSMTLKVAYDTSVLTLVGVEDTGLMPGEMHTSTYISPYTLTWENDTVRENYTVSGTLVNLTFTVSETAEPGEYSIKVTTPVDGIYNYDGENVDFYMVNGCVTVRDYIVGDVNGDGAVTNKDRLLLARYLAAWDGYDLSKIDQNAADINCDGAITNKDRLYLARHLAAWDGYETLPIT